MFADVRFWCFLLLCLSFRTIPFHRFFFLSSRIFFNFIGNNRNRYVNRKRQQTTNNPQSKSLERFKFTVVFFYMVPPRNGFKWFKQQYNETDVRRTFPHTEHRSRGISITTFENFYLIFAYNWQRGTDSQNTAPNYLIRVIRSRKRIEMVFLGCLRISANHNTQWMCGKVINIHNNVYVYLKVLLKCFHQEKWW